MEHQTKSCLEITGTPKKDGMVFTVDIVVGDSCDEMQCRKPIRCTRSYEAAILYAEWVGGRLEVPVVDTVGYDADGGWSPTFGEYWGPAGGQTREIGPNWSFLK